MLLDQDPSGFWRRVEQAEDSLQTNITRSRYLDLTRALLKTTYEASDYYIPEGEQVAAVDHDEFYPDERALRERIIRIFYTER